MFLLLIRKEIQILEELQQNLLETLITLHFVIQLLKIFEGNHSNLF